MAAHLRGKHTGSIGNSDKTFLDRTKTTTKDTGHLNREQKYSNEEFAALDQGWGDILKSFNRQFPGRQCRRVDTLQSTYYLNSKNAMNHQAPSQVFDDLIAQCSLDQPTVHHKNEKEQNRSLIWYELVEPLHFPWLMKH
ncbi:hypothetical protein N7530_012706 [Penicillium desertorum]|uniref:Uncharacterized protein n=1 Tax=Penicillium desertorum TaxID=1303715 RepID=A0A9W9WDJ8_9EURO|nr:hypothetical protein N7530_012706 [Penicillium desertorum]